MPFTRGLPQYTCLPALGIRTEQEAEGRPLKPEVEGKGAELGLGLAKGSLSGRFTYTAENRKGLELETGDGLKPRIGLIERPGVPLWQGLGNCF